MSGRSRWLQRRWLAGLVVCALVAASCSPAPKPSGQATGQPTPGATPAASAEGSPGPSSGATVRLDLPPILLDEVLFAPVDGSSAFIDLHNSGDKPVELAGLSLMFNGMGLPLERSGSALDPGGRLTIQFDGEDRVDGAVYHAPAYFALSPTSGSVELVDFDGSTLDRVAWGSDQPQAVRMSIGGVAEDAVVPGTSIGRAPGSRNGNDQTAWTAYPPDVASPGAPNPVPQVRGLLPVDGAIVPAGNVTLSWYPVPGAPHYRVQVAGDETFASPALDVTVDGPLADASSVAPGVYLWRVQSIGADGSTAAASPPATIELSGTAQASVSLAVARGRTDRGVVLAAADVARRLSVPLISQHKDTAMLLLELNREDGPHAWDVDHGNLDRTDPADNSNCVLGSLAMINHFAGGDMSQDRMGYEIRHTQAPSGPEGDLNYDDGFTDNEMTKLFGFALGVVPVSHPPGDKEQLWADAVASVDLGRPLLASNGYHAFVITGYAITSGRRTLSVNDPWNGSMDVPVDTAPAPLRAKPVEMWDYWLAPVPINARHQEASISTVVNGVASPTDSDGDGVIDFDETERFHTDPQNADTDNDDVGDKEDIFAGNFDDEHGYAIWGNGRSGRDLDHDGLPIELDPDADGGGCTDGKEDLNFNGKREPGEMWNFFPEDDTCQELTGRITFTYAASGKAGHVTDVTQSGSVTIVVRVKPDPADPGAYLDDGSTFTWQQSTETRVPIDTCTQYAHQWVSASRNFSGPDGSLDAHVHDDILLLSAEQVVTAYSYGDLCYTSADGTQELGVDAFAGLNECEGKEQEGLRPGRTFVFDCTQSPYPAPAPGDYAYTTWTVHGFLTVP